MARQLDPTKRKLTDIQCKSAKPLRDENGSIYCDRATCFQVNLKGNHERNVSFYTKWGDWFAYLSVIVTLGLFYFCLSNRFKKKL